MSEATKESIKALEEINKEKEKRGTFSFQASYNKKTVSASGQVDKARTDPPIANAKEAIGANPIIGMGADVVSSAVGGVTQSLTNSAAGSLASVTAPFQSAVGGFVSSLAVLSTMSVEIGMEIARNAARAILKELDAKDKILADLETEIIALNNACMVLAGNPPYLNDYMGNLMAAYNALVSAEKQFTAVTKVLKKRKILAKKSFDKGMADLNTAKTLILPETDATPILRDPLNFVSSQLQTPRNKDKVAAALSIPGITYKIGKLLIQYATVTQYINNLIINYSEALGEFINANNASNDVFSTATASYIDSGIAQIATLLGEMQTVLFPSKTTAANPLFGPIVTVHSTFWGVKVVTIQEWMKFAPIKAFDQLNATGNSVEVYNKSLKDLDAITDIVYVGGKNIVNEGGLEDGYNTSLRILPVLVSANLVIVRTVSPAEIRTTMSRARNHVKAMKTTSSQIRAAITPFTRTTFASTAGAKKVVGALLGSAKSLGLDRAASLISLGSTRELFSLTAETATFAGEAIDKMKGIISELKSSPKASQQDIEKIEGIRDELERERTTKSLEAVRTVAFSTDVQIARNKAALQKSKNRVEVAKAASQKLDATTDATLSLEDDTKQKVSNTVPNYNENFKAIG